MEDNLCFEPIGIRKVLSILIVSLLSLNHWDNLLMSSCRCVTAQLIFSSEA